MSERAEYIGYGCILAAMVVECLIIYWIYG